MTTREVLEDYGVNYLLHEVDRLTDQMAEKLQQREEYRELKRIAETQPGLVKEALYMLLADRMSGIAVDRLEKRLTIAAKVEEMHDKQIAEQQKKLKSEEDAW
ncbi:hypothetical protein [Aeoliella mucimassa]|uniref:Uncharacterized protein n=1 Tax=Aeoliella mucimassa TaxID=2527972 RepID=A0A518AMB1_9BACT|nr:hypothetical protein [Aeoliella mucimassa]QDU55861.1 hypothetical protein Pan181_20580 [Aeoliella mucimassa]